MATYVTPEHRNANSYLKDPNRKRSVRSVIVSLFLFFFFLSIFYQIFSSFTFQMLSRKSPIYYPCPAPFSTHSYFLALAFPSTGAYKVCKTQGPLFPMMAD